MNHIFFFIIILCFFPFPFPFPGILGNDSLWFPFPNCGNGFFLFPSRSGILGIDFFIPFPFPKFRNVFFHSLPVPEFKKCWGSCKYWKCGISQSIPIPVLFPVCEIANLGMGRELRKSIFTIGNRKGMKKIHSHNSGTGITGYYSQKYQGEWKGNEKKTWHTIWQ